MEIEKLSKTERLGLVDMLYETSSDYLNELHGILRSADPLADKRYFRLRDEIGKGIAGLKQQSDTLSRNAATSSLDDVLKFYNTLETVKLNLQIVIEAVNNSYYFELLKSTRSMSFMDRARIWQMRVNEIRHKYREVELAEDAVIFASVIRALELSKNHKSVTETIRRHPAPNRLSIKLLSEIARIGVTPAYAILERYKDVALETRPMPHPDTARHVEAPASWIAGCVHLTPATPYMDPKNLLREYFDYTYDETTPLAENFSKAAKMSCIVIMKDVTREIDYNILPVLSPEYYTRHKLFTNRENGINKLIWRRFDTLRETPHGEHVDNFLQSEVPNSTRYTFVEYTGVLCRVVSQRFGELSVDVSVKNRVVNGVSMRPEAYGEIAEYYILDRCGDPRGRDLPKMYDLRPVKSRPTDSLKKNILDDLTASYTPDTTLEGFAAFSKFTAFCRDGAVYRPVVTRHVVKYLDVREFKSRELRSTFIVKIDGILREFRKKLEDAIARQINVEIFRQRSDYDVYLKGAYRNLISGVIEALDAAPSVWQSVDTTLKEYFMSQRTTR